MNRKTPLFALALLAMAPAVSAQHARFETATPESQQLDAAALEQVSAAIQGYFDDGKIVGGELLVLKNRKVVFHEAYGWRDQENEERMERNTIFNIRSMTKPFSGAALQLLIDEGEVSLDDAVAKHLSAFDNDKSRAITVRQVLTHKSGLQLTAFTEAGGLNQYADLQAIAAHLGETGPEFEPDSKYWYSDGGTDVVAAIVEAVSGKKIDEFVHERFLEPLGMTDSFYVGDVEDPRWQRVASLYIGGNRNWNKFWDATEPLYPFAWGSQSMYSTPRDYAKFLAMWMDGGMAGNTRVMSEAAVARSLTPVSRMTAMGSDTEMPSGYSKLERWYGQMAVLQIPKGSGAGDKPTIIGHSGSDGTIGWCWPDRDLVILFFTQSRGGTAVLSLETVVDQYIINPGDYEDVGDLEAKYAPYLGTYVANFDVFMNDEFRVLVEGKDLALDVPGQMVFKLTEPDESGKRAFQLEARVQVEFLTDDTGAVTTLKIHRPDGSIVELPKGKAPPKPMLTEAECEKYLGKYWSEAEQTHVEISFQNGTLALFRKGLPMKVELRHPTEEGNWHLKVNAAVRLRFNTDADGAIESFTIKEPGGETTLPRMVGDEPPVADETDAG